MLRKLILSLFILFFYAGMRGQQEVYLKKIDSLKQALATTRVDTTKVNQLNYISSYYSGLGDAQNSGLYAQKAMDLAQKTGWNKGAVHAYINMANQPGADVNALLNKALNEGFKSKDKSLIASVYGLLGQTATDYTKKIAYFKKALTLYKHVKDNKNYGRKLSEIAYAYELKGMYFEAIDYRMQNLKFNEQVSNTIGVIDANRMLGLTYLNKNDKVRALQYYERTLKIADKNKADAEFMLDINNDIGQLYADREDYKQALMHYNAALEYANGPRFLKKQVVVLLDISALYFKKSETKQARLYFDKAKQITDGMSISIDKISACSSVADAAYKSGEYQEAAKYYEEILNIGTEFEKAGYPGTEIRQIGMSGLGASYLILAKQQGNNRQLLLKSITCLETVLPVYRQANSFKELQECSQRLAEAYELTGQYSKSITAYKDYITYKDSISSIERENAFTKKEADFEYTQKENDLKTRQKLAIEKEQANRNYAFAGIGVLVLIAGGAGVAYSRKRKDNRLIAAEKKRSDDLLLNILPAEVAEELKATGEASAQYYEQVSIIFTDFVGFTKLSEKFSPEELIGELNYCFKAFDNIITKHNIEKIKTIGDSYMAVSGLPAKHAGHAKNAVEAAVEMRNFIEDYKNERQAQGRVYFEMRTGINSGNVVAGIVGIKKFAYDVWGDAVNIASRMESSGAAGKINISESTYELVKDDYAAEYRGELDAKGKGLIKMYFVEPKQDGWI